jgi:DNA (cytosine-5)-methyltransferase 1
VAQRRRRVFVVGYLGDWRPAAAVLFERHSLRRDLAPSRTAGKEPSAYFESSLAQYREGDIGGTLKASGGVLGGGSKTFLVQKVYENHAQDSRVKEMGETCQTVTSNWGTGGGNVPLVQAFRKSRRAQSVEDYETWVDDGISNTINLFDQGDIRTTHAVVEAYSIREDAGANTFSATPLAVTPALQALRPSVQSHHAQTFIADSAKVRRLTPTECERLQGFPDDFTNIPWRKKDTSPEGLRYKALGNSMAVPCMQWIGDGIDLVDKI